MDEKAQPALPVLYIPAPLPVAESKLPNNWVFSTKGHPPTGSSHYLAALRRDRVESCVCTACNIPVPAQERPWACAEQGRVDPSKARVEAAKRAVTGTECDADIE